MKRIAVLVEGQTEERFVNEVLQPHLNPESGADGFWFQPIVVTTSRTPAGVKHRGGGNWDHYDRDLRRLLGQRHWHRVGLLLDYYAYPGDGPGAESAGESRTRHQDLLAALAYRYPDPRFIPGIALHEFETWVIAALLTASGPFGGAEVRSRLHAVADAHGGDVELIDDGPATAPSKRLADAWPRYIKTVDGIDTLREADLKGVCARCPALAGWVQRLSEA